MINLKALILHSYFSFAQGALTVAQEQQKNAVAQVACALPIHTYQNILRAQHKAVGHGGQKQGCMVQQQLLLAAVVLCCDKLGSLRGQSPNNRGWWGLQKVVWSQLEFVCQLEQLKASRSSHSLLSSTEQSQLSASPRCSLLILLVCFLVCCQFYFFLILQLLVCSGEGPL